jgi:tetratricopeptide (TPR) repeat protein
LTNESLEEFSELSIIEQVDKLISCLNQYRYLIVVDNLEVLLDNQAWKDDGYRQFFSCWKEQGKNSVILLTSQEIPTSLQYEDWLALKGFPKIDGASFLALRLGNRITKSEADQSDLETISELLDGHPLALRLAASYIRLYCGNDNILTRAKQAGLITFPKILKEASDEHRGQQTCLERVLECHLEKLTQECRSILVSLSVYRLPFSEDAVKEITSETETIQALKVLEALVQRSLIIKEQGFYHIQPSIQRYLKSISGIQLTDHQAAIRYYNKKLNPEPWSDIEDIRAHLELFYHQYEVENYLDAFSTVENIVNFLDLRGYTVQAFNMYKALLEALINNGSYQKELCTVWNRLGSIFHDMAQAESSAYCYNQAVKISRIIRERQHEALAVKGLGDYYNKPGSFDQAISHYQYSLKIAEELGDRYIEVDTLSGLGRAYFERGQYNESIDAYERALKRHRSAGIKTQKDRKTELSIVSALAVSYKWQHEYEQAIRVHRELLLLATTAGNKRYQYDALFGLGFIKLAQQKYTDAIDFYNKALELAKDIGLQRQEALIITDLGRICEACHKYQEAIQYYKQALEILYKINDRVGLSWTLMHHANAYRSLKKYKDAIILYNQALDIAYKSTQLKHVIWILCDLGITYDFMQQFEEAKRVYQRAIEIAKQTQYKHHEAISYLHQTISLAKPGDGFNAFLTIQKAKDLFQEMGIKDAEKHCDSVSSQYVFQHSDQLAPQFRIPSIPDPKSDSRKSSLRDTEQSKINFSSENSNSTSDVLRSFSIAFYLLISLFIVANFIQGHIILATTLLFVALFFYLWQRS